VADSSMPTPGTRAHDILTKPIRDEDMPASRPTIKTLFWAIGAIAFLLLIIWLKSHIAPMK
jgi:hypothetical protein